MDTPTQTQTHTHTPWFYCVSFFRSSFPFLTNGLFHRLFVNQIRGKVHLVTSSKKVTNTTTFGNKVQAKCKFYVSDKEKKETQKLLLTV